MRSVLRQTYHVAQHIVIDDGSTDESGEILDELLHNSPWLYVKRVTNRGMPNARNAGLLLLKPEIKVVAFLDGDDWYEPNYIEVCVDHLHEGDFVLPAICYHSEYEGDIYWEPRVSEIGRENLGRPELREPLHPTFEQMWEGCNAHSAAMFHRYVLTSVGGFHGLTNNDCDWDMWLDCLARGYRFAYAPETWINYRVRPGSSSSGPRKRELRNANLLEMSRHFAPDLAARGIEPWTEEKIQRLSDIKPWHRPRGGGLEGRA